MIERTELLGKLRDAADELSMAAKELDRLLAVLAELERVVQNLEENPRFASTNDQHAEQLRS